MNEPGWIKENNLADSLGFVCLKDDSRSPDPKMHWCKFAKGDVHVWLLRDLRWGRATLVDGYFESHRYFKTLHEALTGEAKDV